MKDDQECIQVVKDYLSYFPANCEERPPVRETKDPEDRMSEKLLDIVPESARHPYDMYDVIREIVDDGEIFDIKPKFAKTIITCLARFGGQPVGIVANQPKQLGGILENDSADKAARFINLCDAFNIPLVFLQDVPGFMVGSKVEHAGIIRHGAKMLYAVSRATVPKVTVVVRKAYGAGYYVMNGKAYEPDLIVAWPSAEISVMGAEGAVNIIGRSAIEASDDPEETREKMLEAVRKQIDPYIAAGNAMIDDIIDPRETRPTIIRGLRMAADKRVERPWKKHGVMPYERGRVVGERNGHRGVDCDEVRRSASPDVRRRLTTRSSWMAMPTCEQSAKVTRLTADPAREVAPQLSAMQSRRHGRRMSRFEDPVIISNSISGAIANRDQCPAIPYTPEEYAAEARRASTRAPRRSTSTPAPPTAPRPTRSRTSGRSPRRSGPRSTT